MSIRFWASITPDIPVLKTFMTKYKIASMERKFMKPEEIRAGEDNPDEKERLVELYSNRFPDYTKKFTKKYENVIKASPCFQERKEADIPRTDIYFCLFAYGFAADEYVFFQLEHKSMEERQKYVSDKERIVYSLRMNDFIEMEKFNDKYKTYELYKDFYHREATAIEKPADFEKFQAFVDRHPVFVKKLVDQSCGKSVELIDISAVKNRQELFDTLIAQGKTILEERIEQSAELAKYNPSSINTVRITTFNTRHGIVTPYTFLKNGREGSFVDNGGAGGVLIGIDPETGRLVSDGYDEAGNVFASHPESGVVYKEQTMPDWEQAIDTVKKLALKSPKMKYISWDVAHTPIGWTVVEANLAGQLVAQQMTLQRGIKKELLSLMDDIDLVV